MNLLASLSTDTSIAAAKDSLGGGSFVLETDIYKFKVVSAYITVAQSEAMALELRLKTEDDKELRQTLWIKSGKDKGGQNFYTAKDGSKQYLPGFDLANSLALLTTGLELNKLTTEQKVVKIYNYDAKADVPTPVPMVMDLLDKEIYGAVFKQVVDKQKKGDDGKYHSTGETREENELDKFFRLTDKVTVAEGLANMARKQRGEEPVAGVFFDQWKEKWAGKTRDKTSKDNKGKAGLPGAGGSMFGAAKAAAAGGANAGGKPTGSLFG